MSMKYTVVYINMEVKVKVKLKVCDSLVDELQFSPVGKNTHEPTHIPHSRETLAIVEVIYGVPSSGFYW